MQTSDRRTNAGKTVSRQNVTDALGSGRRRRRGWAPGSRVAVSVVAVALALVSPLFAPSSGQSALSASPEPLTFWVNASLADSPDGPLYGAVERFNETHPGVHVRVEPIPAQGLREKFFTAALGGGGPDIVSLDVAWMAEMAELGLLQDVTDRITPIRDEYLPGPLDSATYRGSVVAVPWYTNNVALFYNERMLAEVGYAAPPETWEELVDVAKKLKEQGDYALSGARSGFGIFLFYPFLMGNGGHTVTSDGSAPAFTSPEAREAFRFYTELYTKHGAMPETVKTASTWDEVLRPFIQERAAMVISGDWGIQPIEEGNPDLQFGIAPIPAPEGGRRATMIGGYNLSVTAGAHDPDGAWEFIRYLTSREAESVLEEADRIAARRDVVERADTVEDVHLAAFIRNAAYGVARAPFPQMTELEDIVGEGYDMVIQGRMGPDEALDWAERRVQSLF